MTDIDDVCGGCNSHPCKCRGTFGRTEREMLLEDIKLLEEYKRQNTLSPQYWQLAKQVQDLEEKNRDLELELKERYTQERKSNDLIDMWIDKAKSLEKENVYMKAIIEEWTNSQWSDFIKENRSKDSLWQRSMQLLKKQSAS